MLCPPDGTGDVDHLGAIWLATPSLASAPSDPKTDAN
jgi:hypothetical protein